VPPAPTQGGLTWLSLLHKELVAGLVEDGEVVIDVLQVEEDLSPSSRYSLSTQ
jgi:hypothetical protein